MNIYLKHLSTLAITNKYYTWYTNIITTALCRDISESSYTEKHHIVPRSFGMGGEKDPANIVELTAREHYICHLLLTKFVPPPYDQKMLYAVTMMASKCLKYSKFNSRLFESLKHQANIARSTNLQGRAFSDSHRANISKSHKGRPGTMKGKKHSAETRSKIGKRSYDNQRGSGNPKSRRVSVNGQTFESVTAAAKHFGIPHQTLLDIFKGRNKSRTVKKYPGIIWDVFYHDETL